MESNRSLEKRVEVLELSLRRTRRITFALAILFTVVVSAAFAGDDAEVRTHKLVLMESEALPGVTLVAGPESSLLIQTPEGDEVLRLGGSPVRRIGGDGH